MHYVCDCRNIVMELSLESLTSLLHSWPTLAEQRETSASAITQLDFVDVPISYSEFFTKYIVANVPCLVGDWLTRSWLSRTSWYSEESGGIQWDRLLLQFGQLGFLNAMLHFFPVMVYRLAHFKFP